VFFVAAATLVPVPITFWVTPARAETVVGAAAVVPPRATVVRPAVALRAAVVVLRDGGGHGGHNSGK